MKYMPHNTKRNRILNYLPMIFFNIFPLLRSSILLIASYHITNFDIVQELNKKTAKENFTRMHYNFTHFSHIFIVKKGLPIMTLLIIHTKCKKLANFIVDHTTRPLKNNAHCPQFSYVHTGEARFSKVNVHNLGTKLSQPYH